VAGARRQVELQGCLFQQRLLWRLQGAVLADSADVQ
jgi:hypothetical protein